MDQQKKHSLKYSESLLASINQETLVGKIIRHRWCNPDGTGQWCTAHIPESYYVQYNSEQEVVSLNLSTNIDNGDLVFFCIIIV